MDMMYIYIMVYNGYIYIMVYNGYSSMMDMCFCKVYSIWDNRGISLMEDNGYEYPT